MLPKPASIKRRGKPARNTINHHLAVLGLEFAYAKPKNRKLTVRERYKSIYQNMEKWAILREAQLAYWQRMKEVANGQHSNEQAKDFGASYGWLKWRLSDAYRPRF